MTEDQRAMYHAIEKDLTTFQSQMQLVKKAEAWAKERGAREFCPASSMAIASDKVEKLYNFMKFE